MPSLVPPLPSNNQQLECNEGKLGGREVIWHIMGYHGETRECRAEGSGERGNVLEVNWTLCGGLCRREGRQTF